MPAPITTAQVWQELDGQLFAVMSFVNAKGEPRSVGVVYVVDGHRLYVATGTDSWKARHLRANPAVAATVTIAKRIPFLPWIKIPAATINLHGRAEVLDLDAVDPAIAHRLLRGLEDDPGRRAETCVLAIDPEGSFTTYGIGVSLRDMRDRDTARGRAPVG